MDDALQPSTCYMKGNGRHMFRAVITNIVLNLFVHYFLNLTSSFGYNGVIHMVSIMLYVVKVFPVYLGWIALFIIYATMSNIKAYKTAFYLLACAQLFLYTSTSLLDFVWLFASLPYDISNLLIHYERILVTLSSTLSIIGLYIIISNKRTDKIVRVSSIIFASYCLLSALNCLALLLAIPLIKALPQVFLLLKPIFSLFFQLAPIRGFYLNNIFVLVYMVILAFFFATLSFTKQKPPKASQAVFPASVD